MRKLGILFLIYFCINTEIKAQEDKTEMVAMAKEMIRGLAQDCKNEEGATDEDIEVMIENKREVSQPSKCVRKCMMKSFNLMEDDGSIPINNFMELAAMLSEGKEDILEMVSEIANKCKDIRDVDPCETAFQFGICIDENARAKQLY